MAVRTYIIALAIVSIVFFRFAMPVWRMGLGLLFVAGFFYLTSSWSKNWSTLPTRIFERRLFGFALAFRVIWVMASYIFYMQVNGNPFEYGAADSIGYDETGRDLSSMPWSFALNYWFGPESSGVSDVGYEFCLTILYKFFGPDIILVRFIKCLLSAWMCLLLYHLSSRMLGEAVGRIAGIMCCLMPLFIIYCGYHLKETEMIFLEVAFLERLDYVIRNRKYNFLNIIAPILLAVSLFFFRTALGAVAILAFTAAVVFTSVPTMKKGGRRFALIAWGVLALVLMAGTTMMNEVEMYWEQKVENVEIKRSYQESKGIKWAKYATGTIMAPMIVALPFSTMVAVEGQESQNTKHGGNYVRNFMAFFALLAIYEAIRQKRWREFILVGVFTFGYLGVIAVSGYSNAERFLLPGLPGLIILWAYGVSELRPGSFKLLKPWCVVVILMEVAWAYFKLGSRGLF